MDATTLINDNLDVIKILEHYDFDNIGDGSHTIRCSCKIHGGSNPTGFVINVENGLWYCHTGSCGGGDIYTLSQHLDECGFNDAVTNIANILNIDIENMEIHERESTHIKELQRWVKLMKENKRTKTQEEYQISETIRKVKKFRNFEKETLEHFKLGFVDEVVLQKKDRTFYKLRNRLVVPIIQNDIQVGLSFRKTKSGDYPKWSHQPIDVKTSDLLYNYDEAIGKESIVIVEGAFDVWAFHEIGVTAVATYGAHITDEQYRMLIKTGADLIFAYDGDDAGQDAFAKAVTGYVKDKKFVQGIFKHKANCYKIHFEENEDPASIDREQLKLNYDRREKIC